MTEPTKKMNCLFCDHFRLSFEADWSDVTPGEGLEICCAKGVWEFDELHEGQAQFQQYMLTAETCDKYYEGGIWDEVHPGGGT